MHAHIVFCHPSPTSFNAALADTARDGLEAQNHTYTQTDLYADGFNPVEGPDRYETRLNAEHFSVLAEQRNAFEAGTLSPQIQHEIDRITAADLLILQFPIWWHGMPAMLKGWFDRVFVSGGIYSSRMRYDQGYFRGRRAICSVTAGAPGSAFGPGARAGDLDQIMWPIHYSLHYLGFSVLPSFLAHGIQGHGYRYKDDSEAGALRAEQLCTWQHRIESAMQSDTLDFPGWADWDELGRPRNSIT